MLTKYGQIRAELEPPFVIEYGVKAPAAESGEGEAEGEATGDAPHLCEPPRLVLVGLGCVRYGFERDTCFFWLPSRSAADRDQRLRGE